MLRCSDKECDLVFADVNEFMRPGKSSENINISNKTEGTIEIITNIEKTQQPKQIDATAQYSSPKTSQVEPKLMEVLPGTQEIAKIEQQQSFSVVSPSESNGVAVKKKNCKKRLPK